MTTIHINATTPLGNAVLSYWHSDEGYAGSVDLGGFTANRIAVYGHIRFALKDGTWVCNWPGEYIRRADYSGNLPPGALEKVRLAAAAVIAAHWSEDMIVQIEVGERAVALLNAHALVEKLTAELEAAQEKLDALTAAMWLV